MGRSSEIRATIGIEDDVFISAKGVYEEYVDSDAPLIVFRDDVIIPDEIITHANNHGVDIIRFKGVD